ncbi:hypothetical protein [Pedobacter metabolipauper]|uniref:Uncharacterized protein n=1 Tax=Pedobacter metabolipauper TaxID=425513 RepID=A0A4V3D137_9SPHI|nr:hypothetical protein [Pedobacter metabolipauper]TDQ08874.1 hypothetical protein ATK78_3394 [Pedobacter metabolipauper]
MIYLIDDNRREQQREYGCNYIADGTYSDVLTVWNRRSESDDFSMLKSAACILLHDSFPDFNSAGEILQGSTKVAENIKDGARIDKCPLVLFSNSFTGFEQGEIKQKEITGLNKRLFYTNLEDFILHYKTIGEIQLKILAYGKNFKHRELEDLHAQIANFIAVHGMEIARKDAIDLVEKFSTISESGEELKKQFADLDGRSYINLLDKIIKFYVRYGRSIYS